MLHSLKLLMQMERRICYLLLFVPNDASPASISRKPEDAGILVVQESSCWRLSLDSRLLQTTFDRLCQHSHNLV